MSKVADRNQRVLLELLKVEGNDRCADCRTRNPRWASWDQGVFLCVQCAGLHRKMGTHVSKVKSLTLDTWSKDQVDFMRSKGNIQRNAELNPDERAHPPPSEIDDSERDAQLYRFVREKYEYRSFTGSAATSPSSVPALSLSSPSPTRTGSPSVASSASSSSTRQAAQPSLSPLARRPSPAPSAASAAMQSPPSLAHRPAPSPAPSAPPLTHTQSQPAPSTSLDSFASLLNPTPTKPGPSRALSESPQNSVKHVRFRSISVPIPDSDDDEDNYGPREPAPRKSTGPKKGILRPSSAAEGATSTATSNWSSAGGLGMSASLTRAMSNGPASNSSAGFRTISPNPFLQPQMTGSYPQQAQQQPVFNTARLTPQFTGHHLAMGGRSVAASPFAPPSFSQSQSSAMAPSRSLDNNSPFDHSFQSGTIPAPSPGAYGVRPQTSPYQQQPSASVWDGLDFLAGGSATTNPNFAPSASPSPFHHSQAQQASFSTSPFDHGPSQLSQSQNASSFLHPQPAAVPSTPFSTNSMPRQPQSSPSFLQPQATAGNSSFLSSSSRSANGAPPSVSPAPSPAPLRPQLTGFVPSSDFGRQMVQEQHGQPSNQPPFAAPLQSNSVHAPLASTPNFGLSASPSSASPFFHRQDASSSLQSSFFGSSQPPKGPAPSFFPSGSGNPPPSQQHPNSQQQPSSYQSPSSYSYHPNGQQATLANPFYSGGGAPSPASGFSMNGMGAALPNPGSSHGYGGQQPTLMNPFSFASGPHGGAAGNGFVGYGGAGGMGW